MSSKNMWDAYRGLIRYYDNLVNAGEPVCPIAHTYITCHIGVLIDSDGVFLCAKAPDVKGELVPVPCTAKSETRTSNIAPHLLHDNLSYVADYAPKYKKRHDAYIQRLEHYVNNCPDDLYAKAIYKYVSKNTLVDDIKDVLNEYDVHTRDKLNILFCVYGMDNEGADKHWSEWYPKQLKPNGICCITGKRDYIPDSYPKCITSASGTEVLFDNGSQVGYIATQKIIHTIQYLVYGKQNRERVEAEEKLQAFFNQKITAEELEAWVLEKHPGKWDKVKNIIYGVENE